MNRNKLPYRWKVHLFFGSGLLLVLAISVAVNLFSGQTLLAATVGAIRQITPMEYVMFFLFWYWLAQGQKTDSRPTFTTLDLGSTKT